MEGSQLPSGTVTFLFTDIEGSTQLWVDYPRSMPSVLGRHHALLRQAIESNGGYVFQIIGDAFCAAFSSATDGLQAAICAWQALEAEPWGEPGLLKVRMALHTGAAEVREGDFTSGEYVSGLTLSRVARLLSAGHGGQILLSKPTRDLLAYDLPTGADFRDLGEHRLKGLSQPEQIFQLLHPDLPADFPPLITLDARRNNLPLQLSSFIGRQQEIHVVKELLSTSRLVTLTGSGGVGKTRLALEVGEELLGDFPDGVWLAELASLSDPHNVIPAIASIFSLQTQPNRPLNQVLLDYLRKKKLLLLLDNCEHLITTCAQLAEMFLQNSKELHILASSREALGIAGEAAYYVPSLSLPEVDHTLSVAAVRDSEAACLFAERASVALPDFEITHENAQAVAQICHRLDGIPLALELAAARVKLLRVEQIAARLDDAFLLLTGGSRTALPRQQTLRSAIDWSYNLLSIPEQALFRRLSVFSGGWELEAAEAICAHMDESIELLPPSDILDLLTSLVNKSLVSVQRKQGIEARYRLLETVRQYAREKLVDAGEMAELRVRHLNYFIALAEQAQPAFRSPEIAHWLERLLFNLDNIRSALEWGLETDPPAALLLASALHLFWYETMYSFEGIDWLKACLQNPENSPRTLQRGRALAVLTDVGYISNIDHPLLSQWAQESLEICNEQRDPFGQAFAHLLLGRFAFNYFGDFSAAMEHLDASLKLFRTVGDGWWEARALLNFADMSTFLGDPTSAKVYLQQCFDIFSELKDESRVAIILQRQSSVLSYFDADLQTGRARLEQGLAILERLNLSDIVVGFQISLANICVFQGDFQQAKEFLSQAIAYYVQSENKYMILFTNQVLGTFLVAQGLFQQAAELLEHTLDQFVLLYPESSELNQKQIIPFLAYALVNLDQIKRAKSFLSSMDRASVASTTDKLFFLRVNGLIAFLEGKALQATHHCREYLAIAHQMQFSMEIFPALEGCAAAFHLLGRHAEAVQCLAGAAAFRAECGAPVWPSDQSFHDRLRSGLLAHLGESAFQAHWQAGSRLSLEQAVALGLTLPSS
jgi:predicted ATPase/class 3 adenylate cyclase